MYVYEMYCSTANYIQMMLCEVNKMDAPVFVHKIERPFHEFYITSSEEFHRTIHIVDVYNYCHKEVLD